MVLEFLSDDANELARRLRKHVGKDRVGVGPSGRALINLWEDRNPRDFGPALRELADVGYIKLDKTVGRGLAEYAEYKEYDMLGVIGAQILEPLQVELDEVEEAN